MTTERAQAYRMVNDAFDHLYNRNTQHPEEMPENTQAMFTLADASVELDSIGGLIRKAIINA